MNFYVKGISIAIATMDSPKYLNQCLRYIKKNTVLPYEVLVYDNGSLKETQNIINNCDIESIKYIQAENKGIMNAWNWGINNASFRHFISLHDDMLVLPKWDIELALAVKKIPVPYRYIYCCRSFEAKSHVKTQVIGKNYGNIEEFDDAALLKDAKEIYKADNGKLIVSPREPMFMHKKLWEDMEGFSIDYWSFASDDWKILKAWNCGTRTFGMCMGSFVYHHSGVTNKKQIVDRDSIEPYLKLKKEFKNTHPNIGDIWQYQVKLLNYYSEINI